LPVQHAEDAQGRRVLQLLQGCLGLYQRAEPCLHHASTGWLPDLALNTGLAATDRERMYPLWPETSDQEPPRRYAHVQNVQSVIPEPQVCKPAHKQQAAPDVVAVIRSAAEVIAVTAAMFVLVRGAFHLPCLQDVSCSVSMRSRLYAHGVLRG